MTERPTPPGGDTDPAQCLAVVGMAGRFPGAPDVDAFWRLLSDGEEAVGPIPPDRWDTGAQLDPVKKIPSVAGLLDDVDHFDPAFFGISPREAEDIDPQQRLMLETGWRTLEHAGVPAADLRGTRTGVYIGALWRDYESARRERGTATTQHTAVGSALDIIATRLSYFLGLRGPSLVVETGCSSALVALDLAAAALRAGDIEGAFVGGVNLILTPDQSIGLTHFGGLSPDGHCRAFGAGANGFVRGEGAIGVYLKRLDKALADGDRVHGVVVATGVNNDGGGHSLVSPNIEAQAELLRRVYDDAGVSPDDLAYVEAHGTGTLRGDPIEAEALGTALATRRSAAAGPLLIGSAKSNIGHLEAAAGLAGLVKTMLVLRHRVVPRSLHTEVPSPKIPFGRLNLAVADRSIALPADRVLHAGVNSFGWGGTNAHVVLRTPPPHEPPAAGESTGLLLPLTAHNGPALRQRAREVLGVLPEDAEGVLRTAGTLGAERDHFPQRVAVTGADPAELRDRLTRFVRDPEAEIPGVVTGRAVERGRVAFVLPGQGSQWAGMGRRLYAESPVFARTVDRCAAALRPYLTADAAAIVAGDDGEEWLDHVDLVQPVLWAMSVGLAALWGAAGVRPDVVVGHSQGEITAATIAGHLSYDDAARVIALRSKLAKRTVGRGRMLAVDLDEDGARRALEGFEDTVSLAVRNGPHSCVLSGDTDAVLMLRELLEAEGTYCRLVNVDYASHCHHMDDLTDELVELLAPVTPRHGDVAMMSTVECREVDGTELGPGYWAANLRRPVRFAAAVTSLLDAGVTHVVEISPHPVLAPALEQLAADRQHPVAVLSTLRRDEGAPADFARALGRAYTEGLSPFGMCPARPGADVPGYPWQRSRFWLPETARRGPGPRGTRFDFTPATGEADLHEARTEVSLQDMPWLRDHRVHDAVVLPGAAMLAFAVAAARSRTGRPPGALYDVRFRSDLTLTEAPARLGALWREDDTGSAGFTLLSLPEGAADWTRHATARVAAGPGGELPPPAGPSADGQDVAADDFYAACAARGLHYGPAFRGVHTLRTGEDEALAEIRLPKACAAGTRPGEIHPALWDAALQVTLSLLPEDVTVVPTAVARVDHTPAADSELTALRSHAVRNADGTFDVTCHDTDDRPVLRMTGLAFQTIEATAVPAVDTERLHGLVFRPAEPLPAADPGEAGHWTVIDAAGDGDALAGALRAAGATVTAHPAAAAADCAGLAARLRARPPQTLVFLAPGAASGLDAQRAGLLALTEAARAATGLPVPPRTVVVTDGAQAVQPEDVPDPGAALYWGFGRVVRREHPELRVALVDVRTDADDWADHCARHLVAADAEDQTALRGADRHIGRLVRGEQEPAAPAVRWTGPAQPFRLSPDGSGLWEGLAFRPLRRGTPATGTVEVEVRAAALNFIDVMKAMGTYPDASAGTGLLGAECAGVVSAVGPGTSGLAVGDRVVACGFGALASHLTVPAEHVRQVPEDMTDAEAAALPLVTATAWYALAEQADLQAGETVLIHSAAGGLGQAAIGVARALGATVIATAGTEEKRERLRASGIEHVLNSRDLSWARELHGITGGRGVDVVLNSLSGAAVDLGLAALAEDGRFVEVGKRDIYASRTISLRAFAKGISLSAVDVAGLITRRPARFARLLETVWRRLTDGSLPRLPVTTRPFAEGAEVLRDMARGTHTGKLVLTGPEHVSGVAPEPLPGGMLRPDASYLVTGGLGALGLSLARFLADRGARHLVLLGRSEPGEAARRAVVALQERGTTVTTCAADVADRAALAAALKRVRAELPPLRGVFHAAGVLDDATVGTLTAASLHRVLAPKVDGALHLDELTADDPLDAFVLFSSVAGLVGNPGQAGYAAGNVFMDALATARRRRGRPALAVQWGPFAEIGLAADEAVRGERLADHGMTGFTADEAWQALAHLLDGDRPVVSYVPLDARRWFDAYPETAAQPSWQAVAELAGGSGTAAAEGEFLGRLRAADEQERAGLVEHKVRELAGRVLRLQAESIDREAPFKSLGLDSLMSLELRNRLETAFGAKFSPTLLWTYGSTAALAGMLAGTVAAGDDTRP